jgi:hypothetical protein
MVTKKIDQSALSESLQFNPRWIFDPVPWYIIEHLDKNARTKLAQHEIELNKTMLKARLEHAENIGKLIK